MPQIGPAEIMMVALVALIVFGPEKLPEIARTVGKALADFRRVVDEAKGEFQSGLNFDDDDEDSHPIREALNTARSDSSREDDDFTWDPPGAYSADDEGLLADQHPSLTPIPMTLDHGTPGEEPDKV
ncbi:MAG: sec-independent protein translocase protein TatA [Actinomycetota bacterium]|jgi:sec-independent protein translocase protein TatA|nr:sec-independent protein translocase protein TatA [Actinomycetota bacterium]